MRDRSLRDAFERFWEWAREHPLAVTTAAAVLVAALALPLARQSTPQPGAPPAELGPDETPLFI